MTCRRLLVAALVACGSVAAGCHREPSYEKPLTPVRVQVMAPSSTATGVRYSAVIEPARKVDVAFRVGGYVRAIAQVRGADGRERALAEGDHVRRGAFLARIEDTDYSQRAQQAHAQLDEAELAEAQAERSLTRARALFGQGALPRPDLEAAETGAGAAKARVAAAEAAARQAQAVREDTQLVAPFDGVVLRTALQIGTLAVPAAPAFTIADVSSVRAVFGAPDVALSSLRIGTTQAIRAEAVPGVEFTGHITNVAPSADPRSRVFDVELTIPNHDDRLKPGMVASLQLGGAPTQSTLLVPLGAITRPRDGGAGYAVFVVTSEEQPVARLREVTLGEMVGNQIAVTDGLRPGDRVIVSGAAMVADGERVRVVI